MWNLSQVLWVIYIYMVISTCLCYTIHTIKVQLPRFLRCTITYYTNFTKRFAQTPSFLTPSWLDSLGIGMWHVTRSATNMLNTYQTYQTHQTYEKNKEMTYNSAEKRSIFIQEKVGSTEFAARCLGKGSDGLAAHPCLIHLRVSDVTWLGIPSEWSECPSPRSK